MAAAQVEEARSASRDAKGWREQLGDFSTRLAAVTREVRMVEERFAGELVQAVQVQIEFLEGRVREEEKAHAACKEYWKRRESNFLQQAQQASDENADGRRLIEEVRLALTASERQYQELLREQEKKDIAHSEQIRSLETNFLLLDSESKAGREQLLLDLEREKQAGEAAGRQARSAVKRLREIQKEHHSLLRHCAAQCNLTFGSEQGQQTSGQWMKTKQRVVPQQVKSRQAHLGSMLNKAKSIESASRRSLKSESRSAAEPKRKRSLEEREEMGKDGVHEQNCDSEGNLVFAANGAVTISNGKLLDPNPARSLFIVPRDQIERLESVDKEEKVAIQASKEKFVQLTGADEEHVDNEEMFLEPKLLQISSRGSEGREEPQVWSTAQERVAAASILLPYRKTNSVNLPSATRRASEGSNINGKSRSHGETLIDDTSHQFRRFSDGHAKGIGENSLSTKDQTERQGSESVPKAPVPLEIPAKKSHENSMPRVEKSSGKMWRTTRSMGGQSKTTKLDLHDDFMATPLDMAMEAIFHATVQAEAMVQDVVAPENGFGDGQHRQSLVAPQQLVHTREVDVTETSNLSGLPSVPKARDVLLSSRGTASNSPSRCTLPELRLHQSVACEDVMCDVSQISGQKRNDKLSVTASDSGKKRHGEGSVFNRELPPTSAFKCHEVVRKKADREVLKGIECTSCKQFYSAVLDENAEGILGNRCEHHQNASRHRYKYLPPSTPDGFWNLGFDTE